MKSKYSGKKYTYQNHVTEGTSHIHDLQQQLRRTLESLEQHKLSSELEHQKRVLLEQQYQQLKDENIELRSEIQKIKRDLSKLSKKYMRNKEQKQCQKCKVDQETMKEVEREREIFIKERTVLKNEIKELRKAMELMENQSEVHQLENILDKLKTELKCKTKTINEQSKVIRFLDHKLSSFQVENMKILASVETVDQRLQELQMENNILKGFPQKSNNMRLNGSIKNMEKDKSRVSRDSY